METMKERCLTFNYSGKDKTQNSKTLAHLLQKKKLDYVYYLQAGDYYPCEFTVRRCGNKWNDIMKLINSIEAPVYRYKTVNFYLKDKYEGIKGNIQEVIYC